MNSVNKPADTSVNPSGLAANLLASLGTSFSSGDPVSSMFANFLTQIQPPPPPAPEPPPNAQTDSSSSVSQSTHGSTHGTKTNDATDTASAVSNSSNANTSAPPPGWSVIGKPHMRDAKSTTDKNKQDDTASNQTNSPSSPPPVPANSVHPDASSNTPVVATAAASANGPSNTTDPNSDPLNTAAPIAVIPQGTNDQAPAAPIAAASVTDTPSSSNGSNDAKGAANNDVTTAQLMLLLMQLERLAAGRLAGMTATAVSDPVNAAGPQDANAGATQPAPGAISDAQGKIDLKALLAELAGQNNAAGAGADTTGQAGNVGTGNNIQNASALSAAATTSLQNTSSASAATSSAATIDDKWMNANFLNQLNLAVNNQHDTGVPFVVNPGINVDPTGTGSGDTAFGTDTQEQGGANMHNAAAGLQTLDANLTPTTGPSQAASPYDFASQLSALRAAKGGPTGLPTPIEQVVLQLSRGLSKDGSSQMTIQLRPAELGRVDVKLNIGSDGKVQGTVTADNPATLGLLLKDARGLERALQEAGLRADSGSLQFNLRGDGQAGGSFGQTADNQSGFANNANNSPESATSLSVLANPSETYYLTPGGVNFRV